MQCAQLMAQAVQNSDIAQLMGIDTATVYHHINSIYHKVPNCTDPDRDPRVMLALWVLGQPPVRWWTIGARPRDRH